MDNYYSNQLVDYITNYDEAITDINNIYNMLNDLYVSFSSASGDDISRIRNDIETVANELNAIKTKIEDAKTKTKEHADNSDAVYVAAKELKPTPTFRSSDYVFESLGDKKIYIENGIIYWSESFRKIPKSSYDSLFGGIAAVGKLFNSYQIIKSTTHQDVESMIQGVVKFI